MFCEVKRKRRDGSLMEGQNNHAQDLLQGYSSRPPRKKLVMDGGVMLEVHTQIRIDGVLGKIKGEPSQGKMFDKLPKLIAPI